MLCSIAQTGDVNHNSLFVIQTQNVSIPHLYKRTSFNQLERINGRIITLITRKPSLVSHHSASSEILTVLIHTYLLFKSVLLCRSDFSHTLYTWSARFSKLLHVRPIHFKIEPFVTFTHHHFRFAHTKLTPFTTVPKISCLSL